MYNATLHTILPDHSALQTAGDLAMLPYHLLWTELWGGKVVVAHVSGSEIEFKNLAYGYMRTIVITHRCTIYLLAFAFVVPGLIIGLVLKIVALLSEETSEIYRRIEALRNTPSSLRVVLPSRTPTSPPTSTPSPASTRGDSPKRPMLLLDADELIQGTLDLFPDPQAIYKDIVGDEGVDVGALEEWVAGYRVKYERYKSEDADNHAYYLQYMPEVLALMDDVLSKLEAVDGDVILDPSKNSKDESLRPLQEGLASFAALKEKICLDIRAKHGPALFE